MPLSGVAKARATIIHLFQYLHYLSAAHHDLKKMTEIIQCELNWIVRGLGPVHGSRHTHTSPSLHRYQA